MIAMMMMMMRVLQDFKSNWRDEAPLNDHIMSYHLLKPTNEPLITVVEDIALLTDEDDDELDRVN